MSPKAPYRLGRFKPVAALMSSSEVAAKPSLQKTSIACASAVSGSKARGRPRPRESGLGAGLGVFCTMLNKTLDRRLLYAKEYKNCKGGTHGALFRPARLLDVGAHRARRSRRRHRAGRGRHPRRTHSRDGRGLSRHQSARLRAGAEARRWNRADREFGHPAIYRRAISGGSARAAGLRSRRASEASAMAELHQRRTSQGAHDAAARRQDAARGEGLDRKPNTPRASPISTPS